MTKMHGVNSVKVILLFSLRNLLNYWVDKQESNGVSFVT
jgi:hypothetical protein